MSRIPFKLVPLVTLAVLAALQAPTLAQNTPPKILQIVHPAAGKVVPAVRLPQRVRELQAAPKFLSWNEKVAALKGLKLPFEGGGTPKTTINLSVQYPSQTVNGVLATLNYKAPSDVYSDWYGTGVATFGNTTTMFPGVGNEPTVEIRLSPLPNKQYLIDAPMYGIVGTYYIWVHVDNEHCFQQIVPNTSRLLIYIPGTTKSGETGIEIRGSIPGRTDWPWYSCQITEL